mgnify:CR=1 FL=1
MDYNYNTNSQHKFYNRGINNQNNQNKNQENFEEEEDDFKNDINENYNNENDDKDSGNYITFKNENEKIKREREPIYIMTIELEKERSDIIQIYNDSSPEDLAFEFCKKNNLNLKAMGYLISEIEKLVNKFNLYHASIQEELDEESIKDKSSNSNKKNNLKNSLSDKFGESNNKKEPSQSFNNLNGSQELANYNKVSREINTKGSRESNLKISSEFNPRGSREFVLNGSQIIQEENQNQQPSATQSPHVSKPPSKTRQISSNVAHRSPNLRPNL